MQQLQSESPAVVGAALNSLIDLYSDEDFDANVKELQLIPALKKFQPTFSQAVHNYGSGEDPDEDVHYLLGMLLDNLPEFIKYKRKHGC